MSTNNTISVNGRQYDAVTGMPIDSTALERQIAPQAKTASAINREAGAAATHLHRTLERSTTLLRRVKRKPVAPTKIVRRPNTGSHMDIARSQTVSKFAAHPAAVSKPVVTSAPAAAVKTHADTTPAKDIPHKAHPAAVRAHQSIQAKKAAARQLAASRPTTAKQVKEAAISTALKKASPAKELPTVSAKRKWLRRLSIVAISVVVIAAGLYIVYRFVPSVSVGVAAAQAGINAKYPEYVPDGYTLNQPIIYSNGKVALKFTSNGGNGFYTINQQSSTWDSPAVLDNVVRPAKGDNYSTTKERGLTIYTYDNDAAWVNGGILYTIDNQTSLSGEQVRRIATSL